MICAIGRAGRERRRLIALADSEATIQLSAVAWYEYTRGPRTAEQIAVARSFFGDDDGIVPLSEFLAERAGEVFRALGSPRRRAADIAIAVPAIELGALLVTRNRRDFAGIRALELEVVA